MQNAVGKLNAAQVFAQLPVFEPKGKVNPKFVGLIYPHENERGTRPFGTAVAADLRKKGIIVEENAISGIAERGPRIRDAIGKKSWPCMLDELFYCCQDLLVIEDVCLCAERASDFFRKHGNDAYVIEIHNMTKPDEDSLAKNDAHASWHRIGETGFIIEGIWKSTCSIIREFTKLLDEKIGFGTVKLTEKDLIRKIGREYGFELDAELEKLAQNFAFLEGFEDAYHAIEIPGRQTPLPDGHKNFRTYFVRKEGNLMVWPSMQFEDAYCKYTYEPMEFARKDVEAVSLIIKLPN